MPVNVKAMDHYTNIKDNTLIQNLGYLVVNAYIVNSEPSRAMNANKFRLIEYDGRNKVTIQTDEDVKYYNLQDQEIINPTKGQLIIKKQGNQTEKKIVR